MGKHRTGWQSHTVDGYLLALNFRSINWKNYVNVHILEFLIPSLPTSAKICKLYPILQLYIRFWWCIFMHNRCYFLRLFVNVPILNLVLSDPRIESSILSSPSEFVFSFFSLPMHTLFIHVHIHLPVPRLALIHVSRSNSFVFCLFT